MSQISESDRALLVEAEAVRRRLWEWLLERLGPDARVLQVYFGLLLGGVLMEMGGGDGERLAGLVEEGRLGIRD